MTYRTGIQILARRTGACGQAPVRRCAFVGGRGDGQRLMTARLERNRNARVRDYCTTWFFTRQAIYAEEAQGAHMRSSRHTSR